MKIGPAKTELFSVETYKHHETKLPFIRKSA